MTREEAITQTDKTVHLVVSQKFYTGRKGEIVHPVFRYYDEWGDEIEDVSHWMPLPAAPDKDNHVPAKAPNEPLTVEQLRGMDGEPVWVKDVRHWALIDIGKGGKWDGVPFAIWVENGVRFYYNILARNLLCYRFPPKTEQEEGNMSRSITNKQVNGIVQSKNLP